MDISTAIAATDTLGRRIAPRRHRTIEEKIKIVKESHFPASSVAEVARRMHVPAVPGLGVRDWHREAFEIHCRVGPAVAFVWALHWLWICLPWARPGIGALFPWCRRRRDRRVILLRELRALLRLELPARGELSPLVGTVQGLGLCAVSGSVIGGMISYAGYFMGVPISGKVLHEVAIEQIVMSWLVWAFVIGHVSMALRHFLTHQAPPAPAIPAQPDTGAS